MNNNKILHVFNNEIKFSKSFFNFLQDNGFDLTKHTLFQYSKTDKEYDTFKMKVVFLSLFSVIKNLNLLKLMFKCDKLVLHNLSSPWLLFYLYLFPSLNKKVYWAVWGKDLYYFKLLKNPRFYHKIYEYFRRNAFKNIAHIITFLEGEYQLTQQWYKAKGKYHKCFMYPSNLYKPMGINDKPHNGINFLVGNSADPSNNHFEIFDTLEKFKNENIKIYSPLSYGNEKYAQAVIQKGQNIFGEKFIPLEEFMAYDDYIKLLQKIDVAIFNHNRQQAFGNTISLLSLGKKVYVKNNTSHYQFFFENNILVFNLNKLDLTTLSTEEKTDNINIIKNIFSENELKTGLKKIFYD